jgi:hypothetical protein
VPKPIECAAVAHSVILRQDEAFDDRSMQTGQRRAWTERHFFSSRVGS